MSDVDLPGLVKAYRKASQSELRARGKGYGKRADDNRQTAARARGELASKLSVGGNASLADALRDEHEAGSAVHAYLIGEGYEPLSIDYPLHQLQRAREQVRALLAPPAGEVSP